MGKKRSAAFLILVTVLILGLCFMCTVSFDYGAFKGFRSFLSSTQKSALLGNDLTLKSDKEISGDYEDNSGITYIGGGYSVVYYPDGVISANAFEDELAMRQALADELAADAEADEDEKAEAAKAVEDYKAEYVRMGSLYFKVGEYDAEDADDQGVATVKDGKVVIDEAFRAAFDGAVAQFKARVRELGYENARVEVRDDYSIEIFIHAFKDATAQAGVFYALGFMGEFDLRYGANETDAAPIKMAEGETIHDYVKSAYFVSNGGTPSVAIRFTKAGREAVASWTQEASGSTYLYFFVGDSPIITLTASQQIDQGTLYISGSYTTPMARMVALTLNTALNGEATNLNFTIREAYRQHALFGDLALTLCYVTFGVLALAMLVFFFVRYRGLGIVHLYTFLIYLLPMIVLTWGISFLYIGIETFLAVLFGMVLLSVSHIVTFESARKEFAQGKTIGTSVKNGYKKCFWGLFDLHIVLAAISFITFAIAIGPLKVFAFTLGLAAVLSGLCSLAIGRFHWATMMTFAKDKGKFCNFKREELEDE